MQGYQVHVTRKNSVHEERKIILQDQRYIN